MNPRRTITVVLSAILFSGCAAYEIPPLAMNHPANPTAAPALPSPVSKTLAYTRADIPSTQAMVAMASEQQAQNRQSAQNDQKTVTGEGKVVATVPNASQIVVEHGEIKGFMEAMTMGYRVDPPALLEGLKFGDKVRFTIDVPKKAIVKIEKIN